MKTGKIVVLLSTVILAIVLAGCDKATMDTSTSKQGESSVAEQFQTEAKNSETQSDLSEEEIKKQCLDEKYDPGKLNLKPYVSIESTLDKSDCYEEYVAFNEGEHSEGYTYSDWQAAIINDLAASDRDEYLKRMKRAEGKESGYNVALDVSDIEIEYVDDSMENVPLQIPDGWYTITKKIAVTIEQNGNYESFKFETPQFDRGYGDLCTKVIFDDKDSYCIHVSAECCYWEAVE